MRLQLGVASAVWITAFSCVIVLFRSTAEEIKIILPMAAMTLTAVSFWCALWLREKDIPLFELGSLFMLAAATYTILPFVAYLLSGMQFSRYSSLWLSATITDSAQMAALAWEHWSFMALFAVGYLFWRGRTPRVAERRLTPPAPSAGWSLVVLWLGIKTWALFLRYRYGVDYTVAYDWQLLDHDEAVSSLPHWFNQIGGIALGIEAALPVAIVVFLVSHWADWRARAGLAVFLMGNLVWFLVNNVGTRTWLFLPFAAAALMYGRNVRRIGLAAVLSGVCAALVVFWVFNETRSASTFADKIALLRAVAEEQDPALKYSTKDEFQIWLGGSALVKELRDSGNMPPVPWQVFAIDILLFVPSQLLPFEKIDPVTWLVDAGIARYGAFEFLTYSPIAQGYLGFGLVEITLRALLLGALFAWIHRKYTTRQQEFFVNVAYLWLMLFAYTSLRNNSTYVFVFFAMRCLPFLVALIVLTKVFGQLDRSQMRSAMRARALQMPPLARVPLEDSARGRTDMRQDRRAPV